MSTSEHDLYRDLLALADDHVALLAEIPGNSERQARAVELRSRIEAARRNALAMSGYLKNVEAWIKVATARLVQVGNRLARTEACHHASDLVHIRRHLDQVGRAVEAARTGEGPQPIHLNDLPVELMDDPQPPSPPPPSGKPLAVIGPGGSFTHSFWPGKAGDVVQLPAGQRVDLSA